MRVRHYRPTRAAIRARQVDDALKRNGAGRYSRTARQKQAQRHRQARITALESRAADGLRPALCADPKNTAEPPRWASKALATLDTVLGTIVGTWSHASAPPAIYHVRAQDSPGTLGTYLPARKDQAGAIVMRADLSAPQYLKTLMHETRHWMQDSGGLIPAGYDLGLAPDDMRDDLEKDAQTFVDRMINAARERALIPAFFQ